MSNVDQYSFYSRFINDRQTKIENNNLRIQQIIYILNQDKEYKKFLSLYKRSKEALQTIDSRLAELKVNYQHHCDSNWISKKANDIQKIEDSIVLYAQKINFINIVLDNFLRKKKFSFLSIFHDYYNYKKTINNEEVKAQTYFFEELYHFKNLYNSISLMFNKISNISTDEEKLKFLLSYYVNKKDELLLLKEKKCEELDQARRLFHTDYYKEKEELEDTKRVIEEKFPFIDVHLRKLISQRRAYHEELEQLNSLNDAYQNQMMNFQKSYNYQETSDICLSKNKKVG